MNQPFRAVIVGFGHIADRLSDDPLMADFFPFATHAQVLSKHPAFSWEAVVDLSDEALERARDRWGIQHLFHHVSELERMFVPDVAVIATPPSGRESIMAALPSLKAVIIEKPLSTSTNDASNLSLFCKRHNIPAQVNYWRRGVKAFHDLANGDLESKIGQPQAIFSTYGNGLFNNASHLVDFIRMILGEVTEVQAIGQPMAISRPTIANDVDLPFSITLTRGAKAICLPLDFDRYREVGIDIWGDRGRVSILQESLSLTQYRRQPNRAVTASHEIASDAGTATSIDVGHALYNLYDNLAASLAHDKPLWSPITSAQTTESVLYAGLLSASEGQRPVRISNQ